MSLEAVEKYIQEFEALKHYPEVKQQRDKLAEENAELKNTISSLEKEIDGLRAELSREAEKRKVAEDGLNAKASSAESLRSPDREV